MQPNSITLCSWHHLKLLVVELMTLEALIHIANRPNFRILGFEIDNALHPHVFSTSQNPHFPVT
jgi:hypothetical protein